MQNGSPSNCPSRIASRVLTALNVSTNLQFGYGLTTFDADFDSQPDRVNVYSENYLRSHTGINAAFNGNGTAIDSVAPTARPPGRRRPSASERMWNMW
ncbi:MAG: hypothetical protein EXR62_09085 [Chloroflexi bacterium]|nr:hypothetical protein [Chloroflexota bacterium]